MVSFLTILASPEFCTAFAATTTTPPQADGYLAVVLGERIIPMWLLPIAGTSDLAAATVDALGAVKTASDVQALSARLQLQADAYVAGVRGSGTWYGLNVSRAWSDHQVHLIWALSNQERVAAKIAVRYDEQS